VRDALGLTYDVSFELSLFDRLPHGWFVVNVTSTPQKIHEAMAASLRVLRTVATQRITPRELQRAKRTVLTRHESEIKVFPRSLHQFLCRSWSGRIVLNRHFCRAASASASHSCTSLSVVSLQRLLCMWRDHHARSIHSFTASGSAICPFRSGSHKLGADDQRNMMRAGQHELAEVADAPASG